MRTVIDGAQEIGHHLDILHGEGLVHFFSSLPCGCERLDGLVIVLALCDGLLENRGVGGNAADSVLLDQPLELAGDGRPAPDKIDPDALSEGFQLQEWVLVHGVSPFNFLFGLARRR